MNGRIDSYQELRWQFNAGDMTPLERMRCAGKSLISGLVLTGLLPSESRYIIPHLLHILGAGSQIKSKVTKYQVSGDSRKQLRTQGLF